AMYLILQQDKPEDYVIATGVTTTVRDFVTMAFAEVGIKLAFKGEQEKEVGYIDAIDKSILEKSEIKNCILKIGQEVVAVDPRYYRPTEVELLIGDPTKAHTKLGWKPKYNLAALVEDMMQSDLKLMKKELFLKNNNFNTLNYFE
ncbi:MAG: GDP-mannose 4,6-dehydratase, partial [Bacteroidia bacterium]|nr:GDP-mannose 4,6-dehydratase [Bacteroidia bacterium]